MSQNKNSQGLKLAFAGVIAAAVAAGSGVAWFSSQTPEAPVQLSVESPAEQPIEADGDAPIEADVDASAASQPDTGESDAADPVAVEPDSPAPSGSTETEVAAVSEDAVDEPVAARPDSAASSERSGPSVYWIGTEDNQVQYDAQRVAVAPNSGAETQLRTAMGELLAGSDATAIPSGTELLGAEVKGQDVYVDLSKEFNEGGGSAAMAARLGQVIYTATAVEPGAQVWISIEGEPLTELGGEGLLIDQPLNVATFEEEFDF